MMFRPYWDAERLRNSPRIQILRERAKRREREREKEGGELCEKDEPKAWDEREYKECD